MEEKELTLSQLFSVIKLNIKKFILWVLIAIFACALVCGIVYFTKKPKYSITVQMNYELFAETEKTTTEKQDIIIHYNKNQNTILKNTLDYYYKENKLTRTAKDKENDLKVLTSALSFSQNGANEFAYDVSIKSLDSIGIDSGKLLNDFLIILENNINEKVFHAYDNINDINNYKYEDKNIVYDDEKQPIENFLDLYEEVYYFMVKRDSACSKYSLKEYTKNDESSTISTINIELSNNVVGNVYTEKTLVYVLNEIVTKDISPLDKTAYSDFLSEYIKRIDKYGFAEKYKALNDIIKDSEKNQYAYDKAVAEIEKNYPLNTIYLNNKYYIDAAISSIGSNANYEIDSEKLGQVKQFFGDLTQKYSEVIKDYNSIIDNYKTDYKIIIKNADIKEEKDVSLKTIALLVIVCAVVAFIMVYFVCFFKMKKEGKFDLEEEKEETKTE